MSQSPMPNQVPANVQQTGNTHQGPLPTPQMRQLQIDMQRVTQQYTALGGTSGNPAQTQPIVQRMQQLKQQYQMLGQQQMNQYRQQQQHLQQQQQQQQQQAVAAAAAVQQQAQQQVQQQQAAAQQAASVRNTQSMQNGQAPGTPAAAAAGAQNAQNAPNGLPQQLDAIFGQPPGPNATPQVMAQWQEQQARVQALFKTMSEMKAKITVTKEELKNPQMPPEQRAIKQQQVSDQITQFHRYQNVLANFSRSARAQQPGSQPAATAASQQSAANSPAQATAKPSPVPPNAAAAPAINSPNIPRPGSAAVNQATPPLQPVANAAPTVQASTTPLVAQPVVAQQVPPGRPTLNNGQVGPATMTGPALARPPITVPFDPSTRILSKRNLSTLLSTIDPSEKLDPDVEDVLLDVADEFIESVVNFSCRLAKHRKTDTLGVEDVKLVLEKEWNIRVMGFSDDKTDSKKRISKEGNKDHKAKLAAVNTAKSLQ